MAIGALAILAALATAAPAPAMAQIPPAPAHWVEDHAGLISPATRDALDARLGGYERATGHQVVVWIGKTLNGAPLDDWAARTFEAWKLGRKGLDDGVAMFILADDRAIRIEVGYGLEDRIPDAVASRIIREVMAPRLAAGDPDGAVTGGAGAVLAAIEGRPWTGGGAAPPQDRLPSTLSLVLGGLATLAVLVLLVTHPRLALWLLWAIIAGGRRGGGGGGGFGGG
ncbi:MAG TPA: TPM domain-containing protein, partial [Kofleriaceae bacterium]